MPSTSGSSLAKTLADPDVLAAAPQIRVDTTDSTSAVRAYYRIWANMAWAESSVFGSGLYALSEEGRQRFEKFPSVKADDYWINAQFHPSERRRVQGALSIVRSAANLRGLVRRKARVLAYARLIDDDLADAPGRPGPRGAGLLDLARSQPQLIPLVGYYVAVALITNGLAAWKIRRNKLDWVSDR
jgi:hypothetical protein